MACEEVELQIEELTFFKDGSMHRAPIQPALLPACPSPASHLHQHQVASKDVPLHAGTWARLFLPPSASARPSHKLPILLYFHGGAFLICSTAQPSYHNFLCNLAAHTNTLIVSVEYRLAPEHPLPAAYIDCFHALLWLNQQAAMGASAEPWLASHGDFSRCFLIGDSAGANIAHNVAMQAVGQGCWDKSQHEEGELGHACVQGMVLVHPFFTCGVDLEAPLPDAKVFKQLKMSPAHPLVDPSSKAAPSLATASLPPALVLAASLDFLTERTVNYHQNLLDAGKQSRLIVTPGEGHVFHLINPTSPNVVPLLDEVRDFVNAIK